MHIKSNLHKKDLFVVYNPPTDFIDKIAEDNKSNESVNKPFYYILKTDTVKTDETSKTMEEDNYSLQFDKKICFAIVPLYLDKFWFNNNSFMVNEPFHIHEKLIENIIDAILSWYNNTPINEWNKEATSFYNSMDYEEAIKTLDKIIKVYDNNYYLISYVHKLRLVIALNNKGLCLLKLGKFDKAASSFNESFDKDQDIDYKFIKRIANFLFKINKSKQALEIWDRIMEKKPELADYYNYVKADVLVKLGRGDEVVRYGRR